MDGKQLKAFVQRIPVMVLALAYAGYLGWDYYGFLNDDTSPLIVARKDVEVAKADNAKLQQRVREGEAFLKALDAKRIELRGLASELDSMKGTLSENLDLPEFMKTVLTEAKRVGLFVVSLKPAGASEKEFYGEHVFDFAFRGVFVQMMLFLDHMANVQKIVRVDNFNIRPKGSTSGKYVEIDGTVQLRAYRYIASKADSLGRESAAGAAPVVPARAAMPAKGGG